MESSYLLNPGTASLSASPHHHRLASSPFSFTNCQHPLFLLCHSTPSKISPLETISFSKLIRAREKRWSGSSRSTMQNARCSTRDSDLEATALGHIPAQPLSGVRSSSGMRQDLNESPVAAETHTEPVLTQVQDRISLNDITSIKIEPGSLPAEDVEVLQWLLQGYLTPRRTLYLVDVHPLCYEGRKPRPTAILHWMKLLFNEVSLADPVIAVMDGERGNDYRKGLLPSYKENRNKYRPLYGVRGPYLKGDEMDLRDAFPCIKAFLTECNVPVLKIEDAEADDVIATLMQQAVTKGMRVVVASPDMDYRQLLSQTVNMVLPLPEFGRWSFYTLQQYTAEHDCDPSSDLGLRCMLGDQSDNIAGLPEWAPGFGRKTALKLMKKHGSLDNLLLASKTRTVGKPYIQEALALHRDALYRNLQVLSLRRDLDITLKDDWCAPRDRSSEARAFRRLQDYLQHRRY